MDKKRNRQDEWLKRHDYVSKCFRIDADTIDRFASFCKERNTTANVEFEKILNEYTRDELMPVYEEKCRQKNNLDGRRVYKIRRDVSEKMDYEFRQLKDGADSPVFRGQWLSSLMELHMQKDKER